MLQEGSRHALSHKGLLLLPPPLVPAAATSPPPAQHLMHLSPTTLDQLSCTHQHAPRFCAGAAAMKVPAALLSPLLPLSSSLAAAIAFTAVYGLLSPLGYAYFGIWKVGRGVHGGW